MGINPKMVTLLRDVRGLTQQQVTDKAGFRQGFQSYIENGLREPSEEKARALAATLDVPCDLLYDTTPIRGGEAQDLHFRRRKTLAVRDRRQFEGKLHLAYVTVDGLLRGVDYEPSLPLPLIDIDETGDPVAAAQHVRRLWRMPTGPVRNLTSYLEAAGMFFIEVTAPPKVDAVTRRGDRGWHVTVLNRNMPGDRERLTKAHEAGHLILHERAFGDETENDANAFAAELLVPGDEIGSDLWGITPRHIGRLLDLRLMWGVSLPFLVQHAKRMGCINERGARTLFTVLNAKGWLHGPVDDRVQKEPPGLLNEIVSVHMNEHGYALDDLATAARMTTARCAAHFGLGDAGPERPRLVRVR